MHFLLFNYLYYLKINNANMTKISVAPYKNASNLTLIYVNKFLNVY